MLCFSCYLLLLVPFNLLSPSPPTPCYYFLSASFSPTSFLHFRFQLSETYWQFAPHYFTLLLPFPPPPRLSPPPPSVLRPVGYSVLWAPFKTNVFLHTFLTTLFTCPHGHPLSCTSASLSLTSGILCYSGRAPVNKSKPGILNIKRLQLFSFRAT